MLLVVLNSLVAADADDVVSVAAAAAAAGAFPFEKLP